MPRALASPGTTRHTSAATAAHTRMNLLKSPLSSRRDPAPLSAQHPNLRRPAADFKARMRFRPLSGWAYSNRRAFHPELGLTATEGPSLWPLATRSSGERLLLQAVPR